MDWGVFQVFAAGGDLASYALLYIVWRFDRRLLKLELNSKKED